MILSLVSGVFWGRLVEGVGNPLAKTAKDGMAGQRIAASNAVDRDITKFQNFIITIVLIVAYVALAIDTVSDAGDAAEVTGLPDFSGTFLVLLGISHAAYVTGKLPHQSGGAPGLTVANRISPTVMPQGVTARNPR